MKKRKMKMMTGWIAALLCAFTLSATAQNTDTAANKTPKYEKYIEKGIAKIKDKLDLTVAQIVEVRKIIQDARSEIISAIGKMQAADKAQKPALRNEFFKNSQSLQQKILSLLSPEQKAKAEKFMQKFEKKIRELDEENEKDEKSEHGK